MKRAMFLGVSMMVVFLTTHAHAESYVTEELFFSGPGGSAGQYDFSGTYYDLTVAVSSSTGQVVQSVSGLDVPANTTLSFSFNQNVTFKRISFSSATTPQFSLREGGRAIGGQLALSGGSSWIYIMNPQPYSNELQISAGNGINIKSILTMYNADMVEGATLVATEPGTFLLLGTGLLGLGWWHRRNEKSHLPLQGAKRKEEKPISPSESMND